VAASTLGSFAGSASDQLEQVIRMADAMMSLVRAQQGPALVGRTTDMVAALVRPPLVTAGGSLELVVEGEGSTRVPAGVARVLIAATLQRAAESARRGETGGALACRVRPAAGVELRVTGVFAPAPRLDDAVAELAKEHGVGVRPTESSITLTFPA
jgi:hypothetical protein